MTAADLHSHVAAFWYALGRLDALDTEEHTRNVTEAEEFASLAAQQSRPLLELYREWMGNRLLAACSTDQHQGEEL